MQTIRIKAGEKFRFIVENESGEIFNKVIDTSQITYHANREDIKVVDMPTMSSNDKKLFSETLGRVTGNDVVGMQACGIPPNPNKVRCEDMPTTITDEVKAQQIKDRGV